MNNAGATCGEDLGYNQVLRESKKMNREWDKVLDLNIKGLFYLRGECMPMLQQGDATIALSGGTNRWLTTLGGQSARYQ